MLITLITITLYDLSLPMNWSGEDNMGQLPSHVYHVNESDSISLHRKQLTNALLDILE